MKKLIALTLAMVLALSLLTACDGILPFNRDKSDSSDSSDSSDRSGNSDNDDGKIDLEKAAERILDDAIASNSFSVAAADAAWKQRGVSKSDLEPVFDYIVDEEKMQAYGDSSHGVIRFTKNNGYLEDGEYDAWLKKAFDATAAASDDGYNIQGFSWGDGDVKLTWDEFINGESFIQTWSYKYNGTIMDVYVEVAKEKASELEGDPYWDAEKEETVWPEWTHYYNGVQIDITTGLQKSWDELWQDMEDAFEEYEDEIRDALEDFAD